MKKELKIFDNPKNVKRLLWGFYVFLGILMVSDFFIHKHSDFHFDAAPQFFAFYGFSCYVGLIFTARFIRIFIKRKEDYYE